MFGSVEPTAYDLRFSLFGIPVRVSIGFWIVGAVMGFQSFKLGPEFLLAWMLVLFVSILVHELGHALVARSFGYPPRIVLYQFGGLAMYEPYRDYTKSRSIAISLAGPAAGFALFGLTWLFQEYACPKLEEAVPQQQLLLIRFVVAQMNWVNLWWGLFNLLPIFPLDGGQICRDLCLTYSPHRGMYYTYQIGAFVAGIAAVLLLLFTREYIYPAVLLGLLCASNISAMQGGRRGW